jgi:DNA-binding transcriptional LysR family regulator
LAELATADSLASEAKAAPRGRLRITAPVTFGSHRLTPLVTRFLRDHPEVEIDLALTDRRVDLVEEGFEVAFRIGPLTASNLMALALAPYRLIACAAPSYLDRRGAPIVPEDLSAHECLGWSRPAGDEWVFARNGEIHRVRVRGRLQTNHGGSLLAAALEGYGIALGPEDLFRDSLAAGRLKRILPAFAGASRPLHLMFVSDRRQTPKITTFIQACVKEFGDDQANQSELRP